MARKKQDDALDTDAETTEEAAPEFDSSFEQAQQMLQDAVAQIRAWEPPPEYSDAHGTAEELGAHRRWRRRMHTDTGEHAIVDAAEITGSNGATDLADADLYGEAELDAEPLELEPLEVEEVEVEEVEATPVEIDEIALEPLEIEAVDDEPVEIEAIEAEPVELDAVAATAGEAGDAVAPDPETAEIDVSEVAVIAATAALAADRAAEGSSPIEAVDDDSYADWDQTEPPVPEKASGRRRRRRDTAAAVGATAALVGADGIADPDTTDDDLADLGSDYEKRTPHRRREQATHLATIDSPSADYVLTIEPGEPLGPASDAPAPPRTDRNRRLLVVVGALVAVLVVAGIGVALLAGGGDDQVASPPANVKPRLEFPAETTPQGMEVQRVWQLQGDQGTNFTGTVKFTNPTSAPVTSTYTEVIPKSLAPSATDIRFSPQPVVVKADPVVQWTETLQPGATATATYEIAVKPDGATRERLLKWQEDREAEIGATTTTTTTLPPPPTTTEPATTVAPPASTSPATTAAPTTTTAPPPPTTAAPVNGNIVVSLYNNGTIDGTFNFSNGVSLTVPAGGQRSSELISVPPGTHVVTLLNGTPADITCSAHASGSGSTATYEVQPGDPYVGCTWTARP